MYWFDYEQAYGKEKGGRLNLEASRVRLMMQKNHSGAFSEHVHDPSRSDDEVYRKWNRSRVSLLSRKSRPELGARGKSMSAIDRLQLEETDGANNGRDIAGPPSDDDDMIIGYGGMGGSVVVRNRLGAPRTVPRLRSAPGFLGLLPD
jgi:hypothetical protein